MTKLPYLPASGEEYEKQRMRCFVRDNFTCQFEALGLPAIEGICECGDPQDKIRYLNCHHKKQRSHGGNHDLDNLITVCKSHHEMIHPHMRFELSQSAKSLPIEYREIPMVDKEL
jgi:hypothetical protein